MSVRKLMVIGWRIGASQVALASRMPLQRDLAASVAQARGEFVKDLVFEEFARG